MSESVKESQEISASQEVVIGQLLIGVTQREAAQSAGISEETVSRWLHGNAAFVAELNRRRSNIWAATEERILNLRTRGIEAVERLLESEDDRVQFQAAQFVLAMTDKAPVGPTDSSDVEASWRRRELSRASRESMVEEMIAARG